MTRWARRSGQTLAVFALAAVGLMAALGLSIDVGNLYLQRRIAQNAADAAARAGARALVVNASVAAAVDSYLAANSWGGVPTTRASGAFVDRNGQELLPLGPLAPPGAVGVRVTARRTVPTYFLGIFGVATTAAEAAATAVATGVTSFTGEPIWPVVVREEPFVVGLEYPIWDEVSEAIGSRGWVDLNGSGGGTTELRDWIRDTGGFIPSASNQVAYESDCSENPCGPPTQYASAITPVMWLYTATGNRNELCSEAGNHIGETVVVLLYNKTAGNGNNVQYRVIGFAAFEVTAVDCSSSNKSIRGRYERIVMSGQTGGGSTSSSLVNLAVLQ